MSCMKFLGALGHFSDTAMLNLDFPSQSMELSEHPCVLHGFVPAQGRSYQELLRASCAGAGASSREAACTGMYRTHVCT